MHFIDRRAVVARTSSRIKISAPDPGAEILNQPLFWMNAELLIPLSKKNVEGKTCRIIFEELICSKKGEIHAANCFHFGQ
jgi:hypothetical protein